MTDPDRAAVDARETIIERWLSEGASESSSEPCGCRWFRHPDYGDVLSECNWCRTVRLQREAEAHHPGRVVLVSGTAEEIAGVIIRVARGR